MSVGNIEQLLVAQSAAAGDGVNIVAPFAGAGEVQLGGSFLVLVAPSKVDSPLHGSIVLCSYNCVDIVAVIVMSTRWNGSIATIVPLPVTEYRRDLTQYLRRK